MKGNEMWTRIFVYEANAQQYEDLFVKIMGAHKTGFQPVKPHGNIGDRGNDGWVQDEGIYYQVYAPDDVNKNTAEAIAKAKADFIKLKEYWDKISPLKEYYFVVNDKYKGVGPYISQLLAEIKDTHNLEKTGLILAQDLENYFNELTPEQKVSILPLLALNDNSKNIYIFLAEQLLQILDIRDWVRTSENLIATAIQHHVVDNFYKASLLINKTELVNTYAELNSSIKLLGESILELVKHFDGHALVKVEEKILRLNKTWKREWVSNYDEQIQRDEAWITELFRKHSNFVYSFNLFATNIRKYIQTDFYNGQVITIVDSLGVYNEMVNSEYLPQQFKENPL